MTNLWSFEFLLKFLVLAQWTLMTVVHLFNLSKSQLTMMLMLMKMVTRLGPRHWWDGHDCLLAQQLTSSKPKSTSAYTSSHKLTSSLTQCTWSETDLSLIVLWAWHTSVNYWNLLLNLLLLEWLYSNKKYFWFHTFSSQSLHLLSSNSLICGCPIYNCVLLKTCILCILAEKLIS